MKHVFLAFTALTATLLFSGCAGYQVGSGKLPFKTIHVQTARSNAFAPQSQALLTQQTAQAILRDGRVQLADKNEAEVTLEILIVSYDRNIAARQQDDTARARGYDLALSAEIALIDNRSGKTLFKNRSLSASVSAYTDSGLQPAEYQSMSTLTRKLAEAIRTETLSVW